MSYQPNPNQPQYYPPVPPQPKKKRKWPWVLLAIAVIGIIAVVASNTDSAKEGFDDAQGNPTTTAAPGAPTTPASVEQQEEATDSLTKEQKNAVRSAEQYISMTGFSKSGLIDQLGFEGYSTEDATAAVESMDIDYNEMAVKSAKQYLSMTGFSRDGLVEQLQFEGYTPEQAAYGADNAE